VLGGRTDGGEVKAVFECLGVDSARFGEASDSLFMVSGTRMARIDNSSVLTVAPDAVVANPLCERIYHNQVEDIYTWHLGYD